MIAIIPARGGSKGLPGKNIKLLHGKPLIAYTIEAALKAKGISRVIVSTDDENIAKVALEYGAEIPFMRPDFLATDEATSLEVYKYTLERLEKEDNICIEDFVVLQPTSPLRNEQHIDEAIALFHDKNAHSVISYCKEAHPILWHKYITEEGKFEEIFEGNYQKNRQEIKATYFPNGAIYIFKKSILVNGNYYNDHSFAYLMDRLFSVDIDTEADFRYAEWQMTNNA